MAHVKRKDLSEHKKTIKGKTVGGLLNAVDIRKSKSIDIFKKSVRKESSIVAANYFESKSVRFVCYLGCGSGYENKELSLQFIRKGIRFSMLLIDANGTDKLEAILRQWTTPIGVLLEGSCEGAASALEKASMESLFDAMHMWLIVENFNNQWNIQEVLEGLNLSVDADLVLASNVGSRFVLTDIFNFGNIQGNKLEKKVIGEWDIEKGLSVSRNSFKYYDRWDFNNLTLRAITVILDQPKVFKPEMLADPGYTPGVSVMTKITTQLLWTLKDEHNFRFNYTIAGRWIGSPERNSTLAVTNSLYWRQQDVSCTCARIFPHWLDWVDVFLPPATQLQTKFYYLILDKGVGDYENRFLTPLSPGVWWWTIASCVAFTLVLAFTAVLEERTEPGLYAAFSVFAIICQQAYEDGINLFDEISSSQGRRMILLVVGLMSMLLYNYYTSSVVSWLLNAAAPTLADMDALINTDLELVFEDIGYTRGWLDNPGFFYYSGFKNPKEDILRTKKVVKAKRTTALLQPVTTGIDLIRSGKYAYHTEPYTAYQVISKKFRDKELCELGSLQMMPPANVYIMAQKRSPYKQFFVWSLMRLNERGHVSAARARASGFTPRCSGQTPRALALGQAAPAFAILAQVGLFSLLILACEVIYHRIQRRKKNKAFNHGASIRGNNSDGV
ncbi:ionotropic receptor 75a-like [Bicyclus anynana]|uniref:Ionotropic receptor 75a-like n=1 Tax=Bicyclus anynana TaxID=110368 RepID=A0ABM3LHQ2_BICAN|nr:ionotropic receptor 75a-like [Bicyclus anynana]